MVRHPGEIKEETEKRFKDIQSKLVRMQEDQKRDLINLENDRKTWESWLGAIAFSLAAISGAVLASPLSNYWALAATVLFLISGIWIATAMKKGFQKTVTDLLKDSNATIALEVEERDIIWELNLHPEREDKLGPQLNQVNLRKMRSAKTIEERNLKSFEDQKPDYIADVWLGIVITGIYLLIVPTLEAFLLQTGLLENLIPLAISLPWFLLVIFFSYDFAKTLNEKKRDRESIIDRKRKNIEKLEKFANQFERDLAEQGL